MDVYIWIVTLCISFVPIQTLTCKREVKCRITRIRSMKAADCYNKEITTFSQCLPKEVEIVDMSHNRIRKLAKEDLKKYSDLKMLYLSDNAVSVIDKETFEGKDYLQTLDLSLNSITKLPSVLFHLPSLQSLYLGQNVNMNIVDVVENTKPVTSPLFHIDISYVLTEEPGELPDFGVMSTLEKYNISGNKLMMMTTKHFAGLCRLKFLDTTNVSIEYEDGCDCWTINTWLKSRNVAFRKFSCIKNEAECQDEVPLDDMKIYEDCLIEVQENLRKSKMKKILLIIVPISAVVILAIVAYFFVRRRRKLKPKKDSTQEMMLNNAATIKA